MCITFFCIQPKTNPRIKLMFCFNREQQTQRKTLKFHQFQDDPNIYAGKDIISGGSWLGFNIKTGLLVLLTNHDLKVPRYGLSRGQLVKHFLSTQLISSQQYDKIDQIVYNKLKEISQKGKQYSAFNLAVINMRSGNAFYICSQNQENPIKLLKNKTHGICNSHIDIVWPKTQRGMKLFDQIVSKAGQINQQQLINSMNNILNDRTSFSENDQDQSAIFVQPYWNLQQKAQRKTKTSFMLVLVQKQQKYHLVAKQITHLGLQSQIKQETVLLLQL